MAGFVILKRDGIANFLNKNVTRIRVSQELIDELKAAGKEKAFDTELNIAARYIRQLKEEAICDGAHIMAIGKEDKVPIIMERVGML